LPPDFSLLRELGEEVLPLPSLPYLHNGIIPFCITIGEKLLEFLNIFSLIRITQTLEIIDDALSLIKLQADIYSS
jgi:hypothetical protein